jgi:Protein of unknown function (DUF1329)
MPIRIVLVLLLSAAAARAATVDGREWPPDPKRYDPPGTAVAPGLKVGETLDEKNAAAAKDLLPPEIQKHYEAGEYHNEIASWPEGLIHHEKSFEEATRQNQGKYDVDKETGTIVEKAGGQPPQYIYGIPFPTIDPQDPQAGVKAVWNTFHTYWNNGSAHTHALIVWVNRRGGADRISNQDVYIQNYDNQNPMYRVPNPHDFSSQSLAVSMSPADLQGTAALNYRFHDPKKRDAAWVYVPALRRVRAVSPANRSDGYLGSDMSQDDGHFFDGKPEDFEFKAVGMRDGLRIADKYSIRGEGGPLVWQSSGGWRNEWPKNLPAAGYQAPDWKGLGWAPASSVVAKRKFWVVEAVPRDKYYQFGKLELWIDAESWIGAWNRKFSWGGDLLNTYQVSGYLRHPAVREGQKEVEWLWSGQQSWACAEAVKRERATVAGLRKDANAPFDTRVTHPIDRLFDMQSLNRFGK